MKRNDFIGLLLNPFSRIAGWPALLVGLCVMALTAVVGYYAGALSDGVLDVHFVDDPANLTWRKAMLFPLVSHVCLVVVCALMSLVFTRNFRLLDLAGTLTFARVPFLFSMLAGLGVTLPSVAEIVADPFMLFRNVGFVVFLLVNVFVVVWVVVWMVYAVRVSCDLKSGKLAMVLILSIVVAEVLAKYLLVRI